MSAQEPPEGERLQKVLARAGVASRRAAEDLIAAGRVSVNGVVVREMGHRVTPDDRVELDGRAVATRASPVYLALNKPVSYVTTLRDPEGRPTIMDLVRRRERIYPIGRLDWDTEGLLLLSNDGELTHRLTHPRYGVEKEYHALVTGYPNQITLRRLAGGVELEDGLTAPATARRLRQDREGIWLSITIHEGRNRQVRRMLEVVKHPAIRLIRVRFGPVELGDLPLGRHRELTPDEVEGLRRVTGLTSSAAPVRDAPAARSSAPASSRRSSGTRSSLPRRRGR